MKLRLPGRVWVTIHRLQNRWADVRAIAAGYCNHNPYSPIPGEGGGYADWRCARPGGHIGRHRFNNYTWGPDGRTEYNPTNCDPRLYSYSLPYRRTMTLTMRQQRVRNRWDRTEQQRIRTRLGLGG